MALRLTVDAVNSIPSVTTDPCGNELCSSWPSAGNSNGGSLFLAAALSVKVEPSPHAYKSLSFLTIRKYIYGKSNTCSCSALTLQMFIACRGIPVLVGFLEADYAKYRFVLSLLLFHIDSTDHVIGKWKLHKDERIEI